MMIESLDELADLVVPLFADVENKNIDVPQWLDHPYGPDQLQVCVKSVSQSASESFSEFTLK